MTSERPQSSPNGAISLAELLRKDAAAAGFEACAITKASLPAMHGARLRAALDAGHHGTMTWLEAKAERRRSPDALWPKARSAVVVAMNYGPDEDPLTGLARPDRAVISVYARNRDYHDVMKGRLKTMAQRLASRSGHDVKVFVDTAPIMEKPLAQQAGIGWQGKHTNLVARKGGSWLFLGVILTDGPLPYDNPETDHCGNCRACLDICPTNAFPAPYRLDARRCISYLTIEHEGMIDRALRPAIGNRIYGCDDCLAVCPWNKFASQARETKLQAREENRLPRLADLVRLDDRGFRERFAGSPIKRIGRNRFVRNVLVAIGNSGQASLAAPVANCLRDHDVTVRAMAVWALSRLVPKSRFVSEMQRETNMETSSIVLDEWRLGAGTS